MEDIENKDVSDPLKHLLSLDIGLASPLDEFSEDFGVVSKGTRKRLKRVQFADPIVQSDETIYIIKDKTTLAQQQLQGILKNKLTLEESDLSRSYLTTEGLPEEDEYTDVFTDDEDDSEYEYNLPEESKTNSNEVLTPIIELNEDISHDVTNASDFTNITDINKLELITKDVEEVFSPAIKNVEISPDVFFSSAQSFHSPVISSIIENIKDHSFDSPIISPVVETVEEIISPIEDLNTLPELNKDDYKVFTVQDETEISVNLASKEKSSSIKLLKHHIKGLPHIESKVMKDDATSIKSETKSQVYKKPALHFCIISLLADGGNFPEQHIENLSQYYAGISTRPGVTASQMSHKNEAFCMLTQQSKKLKQVLSDEELIMSGKNLRLSVFNAWCKLKEDNKAICSEKSDLENSKKEKKKRLEEAKDAFIAWKLKKDNVIQKKKKGDSKPKNEKHSSTENNLVYDAWKRQKNECLKKERERKRSKAEEEKRLKENQTYEALSAFNAWKDNKRKLEQEKKHLNLLKAEKLRKRVEVSEKEKLQRNIESEDAYSQWLEQKYSEKRKENKIKKNPWYPAG